MGKGESLCVTCEPDLHWNAVRIGSLPVFRLEVVEVVWKLGSFDSGSSATLSPWRSGESCLSKEQRETPLTHSTKVK